MMWLIWPRTSAAFPFEILISVSAIDSAEMDCRLDVSKVLRENLFPIKLSRSETKEELKLV
jgi:hypothetical protein